MPPDQGCYEERYRLTGGAVLGLASGLVALSLGFVWHTQAIFGVLTAVFLVLASLTGGVIEAAGGRSRSARTTPASR